MSNKIYKNYTINLGVPFEVKVPVGEAFDCEYAYGPEGMPLEDMRGMPFEDMRGMPFEGLSGAPYEGLGGASLEGLGGMPADDLRGAPNRDSHGAPNRDSHGAPYRDTHEAPDENCGGDPGAELSKARAEAGRIVREANAEGAAVLAVADAESRRLVEDSQAEAEAQKKKARETAESEAAALYAKARRDGEAEGRAAYDRLIEEAGRLRDEAEEEYRRLMENAEGDALGLVLEIAKKVVGEELAYNRRSLLNMIKDAFSHCINKSEVIIKVSQEDYDFVSESRDVLLSMTEGVDALEVRRDLSLAAGSCLIETPFGNMDAGAATRFSKIEDAFYRILSAQRSTADEDDDMIA